MMASHNQVCIRVLRKQLQQFRSSLRATPKRRIHSSGRYALPRPRKTTLQSTLTSRPFTTLSTPSEILRSYVAKARYENPILFTTLYISAAVALSTAIYFVYKEQTKDGSQFEAWPEPVELQLRLALGFTHVTPDPEAAATYFLRAVEAANICGMDPFSREVLGIRIRLAEMLEQFGRARQSIDVLEGIVKDCEEMLELLSRTTLQKQLAGDQLPSREEDQIRWSAMLRSVIQAKVKIAGIYDSDYIQDPQTAKKILSDAIGMLFQHTQDPQKKGFSEENSAGLTLEEIASMLSQMGDMYATSGEESNAIQVYMLTLDPLRRACNGTRSCKEVQILSNIAASMGMALKKPSPVINGKPATEQSMMAARQAAIKWADQAIATADAVESDERDSICELGLLSALMTRGDLLLDTGDKLRGREVFRTLLPTLKEKRLSSLIQVAEDGLKRAED